MNPYQITDANAARRVLVAVIKQAFKDYLGFVRRGLIVKGRVPDRPRRLDRQSRRSLAERREAENLVKFFKPGGDMDRLIEVGRLDFRGPAVRRRLRVAAKNKLRTNRTSRRGGQSGLFVA